MTITQIIFAHVGGDEIRQENGGHIDVDTWNAFFAFGHKNKKWTEKDILEKF